MENVNITNAQIKITLVIYWTKCLDRLFCVVWNTNVNFSIVLIQNVCNFRTYWYYTRYIGIDIEQNQTDIQCILCGAVVAFVVVVVLQFFSSFERAKLAFSSFWRAFSIFYVPKEHDVGMAHRWRRKTVHHHCVLEKWEGVRAKRFIMWRHDSCYCWSF